MSLHLQSNAKINLYLRVVGKRQDGYHELVTLMAPITLADEMTIAPHTGVALECDEPALPTDSRNLAVKAAELLRKKFAVRKGARITLSKRIPIGAGLGGGSSNATCALRGLNALWGLGLGDTELEQLAAELGSDTAFFVRNRPALATGRGEKLRPLQLGEKVPLLLLNFGFGSSTAWAYQHCAPGLRQDPAWPEPLTAASIASLLRNDLEPAVFRKFPVLAIALDFLRRQKGVLGAMMSGSGSTLFAVLDGSESFSPIRSAIRKKYPADVWVERAEIVSSAAN